MVEDWTNIQGNIVERRQIPNIVLKFKMNELKLTLLSNVDDYKGLMLQSRNIQVDLLLYDSSNKYNKRSMELSFKNASYGVWVVEKNHETRRIESSPFMQQLMTDEGKDPLKTIERYGEALILKVG